MENVDVDEDWEPSIPWIFAPGYIFDATDISKEILILYLINTLIWVDINMCIAMFKKETYLISLSIETLKSLNHILHQI